MIDLTRSRNAVALLAARFIAPPSFAASSGTDIFLPSVGRAPGISNWDTTVWVHNHGAPTATAQFTFLVRDQANPAATLVTQSIPAGASVKYANAMSETFGREGFGAIRVMSGQRFVVDPRIFAKAMAESQKDSKGQLLAGVSVSFAEDRKGLRDALACSWRRTFASWSRRTSPRPSVGSASTRRHSASHPRGTSRLCAIPICRKSS